MHIKPRSGELSTLLVIVSALTILAGTIIGAQSVSTKSALSKLLKAAGVPTAAPLSCPYKTTFEVRKDSAKGALLNPVEMTGGQWGVYNNKQGNLVPAGRFNLLSQTNYTTSNLVLDGAGQNYTKAGKASVTLVGPDLSNNWKIKGIYCNSATGAAVNGCPTDITTQNSSPSKTISNFTVDCGVNLTYGWIVEAANSVPPSTPGSPSGKQSYQLDVSDGSGAANDMCYMVVDSNGTTYSPTGSDHCNSAVCKNGTATSKIIVDYKNISSSSKTISWQQNACNGKIIGSLEGTGKNECNDYLDSKPASSLAAGRTIRCIWDSPVPKQSPDINTDPNCSILAEADTSTPQSICSNTGGTNPQPTTASNPQPSGSSQHQRTLITKFIITNKYGRTPQPVSIENISLSFRIGSERSDIIRRSEKVINVQGDSTSAPTHQFISRLPLADPVPFTEYESTITAHIKSGSNVREYTCTGNPPSPMISRVRNMTLELILHPDNTVTCNGKTITSGKQPIPTSTALPPIGGPTGTAPTSAVVPTSAPSGQACERVAGTGNWGIGFAASQSISDSDLDMAINETINSLNASGLGNITQNFSYYKISERFNYDACNSFDANCILALRAKLLLLKLPTNCPSINTLVHYVPDITGSNGFSQRGSNTANIKLDLNFVGDDTLHELGHAIASLADEYFPISAVLEKEISIRGTDLPNCSFTSDCSKWASITNECIPGCSSKSWYKSSTDSIMNVTIVDLTGKRISSTSFNNVSLINGWKKVFPDAPSALSTKSAPKLQKIIDLTLNQNPAISLKSLDVRQGYVPDKSPFDSLNSNSVAINLVSATGTTIYTKYEDLTYQVTHGDGEIFRPKELYVRLPYLSNAVKITVTDDKGKKLLEVPLTAQIQALSNKTKLKAVCGNTICDAGFGETINSCSVDCGPKKKTDLDRKLESLAADLDGNKIIDSKDLAILLKMYGKKQKVEGIKQDINHDGVVNGLDYTILTSNAGMKL